jgi:hypothetical protein
MSYPGRPPPGHGGYWNGHDPPNPRLYATQEMRPQPAQNGLDPQYQPPYRPPYQPHFNTHTGQYQNSVPHYPQAESNMSTVPPMNGFHISSPAQLPLEQSEFINPAQLFSQPPTHRAQPIQQAVHGSAASNSIPKPSSRTAPIQHSHAPLDRPLLLMSLAEEFFSAAHDLAPAVSLSRTSENVEVYEKLISTGLGCLDTALRNVRLTPRVEANIRLRYAGVLYEETDNFMEAETALNKGIALCDRVSPQSFGAYTF